MAISVEQLIEQVKEEMIKKDYYIKETVNTGSYYELMAPYSLDDVEYINNFIKRFPSQSWKIHKELFFDSDELWSEDHYYVLYIKMKNMNNGFSALEELLMFFKNL